jgi:hypothetical protein
MKQGGGGLVVMPDIFMTAHRAPIISAAARNNVPAVFYLSAFARDGGLNGTDGRSKMRPSDRYIGQRVLEIGEITACGSTGTERPPRLKPRYRGDRQPREM